MASGTVRVQRKTESQEEKFRRMTEERVPRLISTLAVPTILSMLVTSIYNMADTYFVGEMNDTAATAAIGVTLPLMSIIQAIGFFFGHGSGNYISRKLGERNTEEAEKMAMTGFGLCFLCVMLIAWPLFFFAEPLSYLFGATETIAPFAGEYIRIILLAAPVMASSLVLNNQLRFQGNATYAMIGILSGAVLNMGLDPLFITTLGMGVTGAAVATVIGQAVGFCLLLAGVFRSSAVKLRPRRFTPCPAYYGEILRGGLPSLFRQGLAAVAGVSLNMAAHVATPEAKDATIAAMTIVSRITMFANAALIGFGQGFQPVCGYNYGARRYDRVKEGFSFCVKVASVALLVIAAGCYAAAPQAVAFFRREDADVIRVGAEALRWQCVTMPLGGFVVMANMMLQASGRAIPATILASAKQGIFYLPAVWILPRLIGVTGIMLAQPIADIFAFIISFPLTIRYFRSCRQNAEPSLPV